MRLAKVTAGHWTDGGSGHDFERRYEFAQDCIEKGKVAISFLFPEGHPFDGDTTEADIHSLTTADLKAMYEEEGIKEGTAKNAAEQVIRFRDWPVGTPLFLYLGRNKVYRLGYLSGEYEFNWDGHFNTKYDYAHVREVEWASVPELVSRKEFPEEFQGWLKNPQTVLDHDIEPRTGEADFLSLAYGLGQALSGVSAAERSILK